MVCQGGRKCYRGCGCEVVEANTYVEHALSASRKIHKSQFCAKIRALCWQSDRWTTHKLKTHVTSPTRCPHWPVLIVDHGAISSSEHSRNAEKIALQKAPKISAGRSRTWAMQKNRHLKGPILEENHSQRTEKTSHHDRRTCIQGLATTLPSRNIGTKNSIFDSGPVKSMSAGCTTGHAPNDVPASLSTNSQIKV